MTARSNERLRTVLRVLFAFLCVGALVSTALGVAVSLGVLEPDRLCSGCHADERSALAAHTHTDLSCYDCHAGPDPTTRALRIVRDVETLFMWWSDDIRDAFVSDDVCLGCHEQVWSSVLEVEGLRIE